MEHDELENFRCQRVDFCVQIENMGIYPRDVEADEQSFKQLSVLLLHREILSSKTKAVDLQILEIKLEMAPLEGLI